MRRALFYIVLTIVALVVIFPIYWTVATSIKPQSEVLQYPPTMIPRSVTFENYASILVRADFFRYLANSLFVVGVSTFIAVFTSGLGGYIFAKFRFPGRNYLFLLILATTMIPFQTYMVPFYLLSKNLGLIDTYLGIMMPLFVTAFGLFFVRQNAFSIPDEYLDAARIDGAGEWYLFSRVILRMLKAPLAAITIFAFMFGWKFFIWPLIITNTPDKFVLEVGLASFAKENALSYGLQMAGAVVSIIPILAVFLVFRRKFVGGLALTGMK